MRLGLKAYAALCAHIGPGYSISWPVVSLDAGNNHPAGVNTTVVKLGGQNWNSARVLMSVAIYLSINYMACVTGH